MCLSFNDEWGLIIIIFFVIIFVFIVVVVLFGGVQQVGYEKLFNDVQIIRPPVEADDR